jgi:hypothetical protein
MGYLGTGGLAKSFQKAIARFLRKRAIDLSIAHNIRPELHPEDDVS